VAEGDVAAPGDEMPTVALSKSELDAVESVWSRADSSREAEIAPPATEPDPVPEVEPAADDRYQLDSATADVESEDRYSGPSLPVVPPTMPTGDVTRGQEPSEYAAVPDDAIGDDGSTSSDVSIESSRRARDAFSADVAAAAPSRAIASDRYGSDTAASAASERSPRTAANPFDEPRAATPIATHTAEPVEYEPEPMRTANAYREGPATTSSPGYQNGALPSYGATDPSSAGEGTGRPGERAFEGAQNPALVIQKFAPPEIQVGKATKFAIQIRNTGGQTAENVLIRDEIPAGTKLVNSTPKATSDGSHLVWDVGALSTGEERTVEIELMPTTEGEVGSVATVSYTAQASVKTRCTEPQLAIRMTAPRQVMIGQEQRVNIELRNPGSGDATGVMLLENVPQNVKHAAGPALEFEIGTLRAGETREMELVLTAEKAGPVENVLTARADGNLQVQQSVEFEVIAPDLRISVDGPATRYLERPATYQVSIENPGTAPAHDIELVTKLPKGMQFVKANNMGEYDAATHSVYWSLAQLPEGERGAVELVAMPVEAGQQTLEIEGKAQQGLADEVKQDVTVKGIAALMFEVRDLEDPIEVGGETTYEIRVVNQGSKAATNVQVAVALPPEGIEAVSASGETGHQVNAGGIVFEPLAQLAPKSDTVYRVQVRGKQPGDQRIQVQVNSDEFTQPIRREESTRVFGDE
jgi:uncharacterized repeat protein (TIGR01451 family)